MAFTELKGLNKCWLPLAEKETAVWKKGHYIDQENRNPYILFKGRIKLVGTTPDGLEKILWSLGDGCIFNETLAFNALYGRKDWISDGVIFTHVCQRDCLVGRIPMARLLEAGRMNPELFVNLCHSYSVKLLLVAQDIVASQLQTQRTRVFRYLAQNLILGSMPPRYERGMTLSEVANLLGMHRISLYKVLKQAESEGVLELDNRRKTIVVLDSPRFFDLAGK